MKFSRSLLFFFFSLNSDLSSIYFEVRGFCLDEATLCMLALLIESYLIVMDSLKF